MSLFQTSVLNKYLSAQDQNQVDKAYEKYAEYFHNKSIQENIRAAKEEQFQEGFLRELFVKVLGYTLNPEPEYNLTTELKNEKNAKKCDGAILKDGNAIAVIELKGTGTTDLDTVNDQAFNYKHNQTGCIYVITSNFEKLRFYIHNAVEHIEFNLFKINKADFSLLWFCLNDNNLINGVPEKAKNESLIAEENITKNLYKDYAAFKNDLWFNVTENHPDLDQLLLYKKSQKLLDRFLFILFSEDCGLLSPNTITHQINRWEQLVELDHPAPLYDIFKQYFSYINTGKKGKIEIEDIFAYNGGLFAPDEVLDAVSIDDKLLKINLGKLTSYDFNSEIDVNILGHIFENSLNEIENVRARLEGLEVDKNKSKRKKDGVYYTPKFITKYIVDSTVGKLCQLKKEELEIVEKDYLKEKKGRKKTTLTKLKERIESYRNWLLQITICDPACGSGAFLNQALEFLISEHAYIDELETKLFGSGFVFRHVSDHILENNLYGVDINEESIEIAKLSLWLRTAQKGRKLTSLNNNIKCGNSIIDDKNISNEKAFIWNQEFPNVFDDGGFDVVIGNPPYGAYLSGDEKDYIKQNYVSMEGDFDTYIYFVEKTLSITKDKGECGLIIPNNILLQKFCSKIRGQLLLKSNINSIIDLGLDVFDDAVVPVAIITYQPNIEVNESNSVSYLFRPDDVDFNFSFNTCSQKEFYSNPNLAFNIQASNKDKAILNILDTDSEKLKDVCELKIGIEGTPNYINDSIVSSISKPMVRGRNFHRYLMDFESDPKFIEYDKKLLHRAREERLFDCPRKIVIRQTGDRVIATIDEDRLYAWKSVFVILSDENNLSLEYLLALLNSKVLNFYYQKLVGESGRAFAQVKGVNLDLLPIKVIPKNKQSYFIGEVKQIIEMGGRFTNKNKQFKDYIKSSLNIPLSRKLGNWVDIEFSSFINEINKILKKEKKRVIAKEDEFEWSNLFLKQKTEALNFRSIMQIKIKELDNEICKLYGLSDDEIKFIENQNT